MVILISTIPHAVLCATHIGYMWLYYVNGRVMHGPWNSWGTISWSWNGTECKKSMGQSWYEWYNTYYSAICETICEVNQNACHIAKHFFFPWFTCTLSIVSISNRYLCGIALYFSYRLNCMMRNIFWLISNVQNPNGSHSINSYGAISGAAQNKRQIWGIWGSFSFFFSGISYLSCCIPDL